MTREIQKLLEADVIEESDSPRCSPIVPVKKSDGSVRVCVDYRRLNQITPFNIFYLPTLDDLLERVGSLSILSRWTWRLGSTKSLFIQVARTLPSLFARQASISSNACHLGCVMPRRSFNRP